MNELQVFNSPEFGELRATEFGGMPWFVAADVCRVLELTNPTVSMDRLDDDEKAKLNLGLPGGDTWCVNEYGLYTLVLGSRKPEAKVFKRWLTHEVIPSIRKQGAYIAPQAQSQALDAAALQAFTSAMEAMTATVQSLARRMDALEQGRGEMRALPPPPERNPFEDVPSVVGVQPKPSSTAARKLWMRLVNEKLDLLHARFGKSNNAILHKIYQDMEAHFDTVMDEERCRIMEEQGLEKCSVLLAIFFDPELRDYFQQYIDYNLAPENRGW